MREDLLDAQAAVDWAISDFPILQRKIDAWLNSGPYKIVADVNSQPGKKLLRFRDVKPIPGIINAETGIIIHSIRSSLDILAVALAERNSHTSPKDVYFPIAQSRTAFFNPKDGAYKKIERLSSADIVKIENLKPWDGEDNLLFEMHDLDRTRKHRRLLGAFAVPNQIIVDPKRYAKGGLNFVPVWPGFKEDAIIATADANATESDFVISLEIRIAEAGLVSMKPVITALRDFASAAQAIIKLFDAPEI